MSKTSISYREYFLLNMNPVIRFMIMADVMWRGATGFLAPIFGIFIIDRIQGGNAAVAGIAATIYLFSKSFFQIPFASIIDKIHGEKDDYKFLIFGSFTSALIPIFYLWVHTPTELYITQFAYGLASAAMFPSWSAIFTRHMDKHREGVEWGAYFTLTDLSAAGAAAIGGVLAFTSGFPTLIITSVLINLVSCLFFLPIKSHTHMPVPHKSIPEIKTDS